VAEPIDSLITALRASDELSEVSVTGVRPQVSPPAIVIRPDEPWLEPDRFCVPLQRYVAVPTVAAASAEDGIGSLMLMALAIIEALPDGWDWSGVGAPIIDESTGTAFLVAPVRLKYSGS
jgi:hypothetical protein